MSRFIRLFFLHMEKKIVITALFLGATAIILGAFGAHALKKVLSPDQLTSFETGVKYQMYHALFLLFVSFTQLISDSQKNIIFFSTLIGVLFFSGSIYILTNSNFFGIYKKIIGPLTPIGGLFLLFSWFYLIVAIFVKKAN